MSLIYPFSFTIQSSPVVGDTISPWVRNALPNSPGVGGYTNISFEVYDDSSGVNLSSINAYLNGNLIYSNGFISPFNGVGSSVVAANQDGYDGYVFNFVNSNYLLPPATDNNVLVYFEDNYGNSDSYGWQFKTGADIRNVEVGEFETNLIVTFGDDMQASTVTQPANYVFSNGMYARSAEVVDGKTVKLWVELFSQNPSFSLETKNLLDMYGCEIPSSYNSFTFEPFISDAGITSYNAKIRTWHHSTVIFADSERVYIGGTKGIDVFRKVSSTNLRRWGQILDAYGIQAMFVMNYPDELVVVDSVAPQLINRSPAPNSRTPSVPQIQFTIVDAVTAIEPTSVTIYVNGVLAFRGEYGGWSNDFSGQLDVGYKKLDLTLIPPTPFMLGEVVVMRVIAFDLLGNRLDSTYQFAIGSSAIVTGWGGGSFGTFGWGGI